MRIRFMVGHRANNRPKIKMARVDGCSFFKRGDKWKHVDRSCERNDHFIWTMILTIGACILRRVGVAWKHDQLCTEASAWQRYQEKLAVASDDKVKVYEEAVERAVKAKTEMEIAVAVIEALMRWTEKPACLLDPLDVPLSIGDCKFQMVADEFIHLGKRCSLREHNAQIGNRKVRLIRTPGRAVNDFTKMANDAIPKAFALVPPGTRDHITVEI